MSKITPAVSMDGIRELLGGPPDTSGLDDLRKSLDKVRDDWAEDVAAARNFKISFAAAGIPRPSDDPWDMPVGVPF